MPRALGGNAKSSNTEKGVHGEKVCALRIYIYIYIWMDGERERERERERKRERERDEMR